MLAFFFDLRQSERLVKSDYKEKLVEKTDQLSGTTFTD